VKLALVTECGRFKAGIEQFLHDLSLELRERGVECGLVFGERSGERSPEYLRAFSWNEHLPFLDLAPGELRRGWLDLLERRAPDVVYLHKIDRLEALRELAGPAATFRMIHDHESYCLTGRKYFYLHSQKECERPVGLGCYPRCLGLRKRRGSGFPLQIESARGRREDLALSAATRGLVVDSGYMRGQLVLNGIPLEKIAVIPTFTRPVERPSPYPADSGRILFVGRLHREKGVDDFLRALARLERPFEASVFGYGDVARAAALARELGVLPRVRLYGPASPAEVDRAYRQAALVVMPSKWPEPLGLVGLEAMSHARPVVAYRTGGIPDWLVHGETGLLVERLDVAALAGAMERVLADPGLGRRMGEQGRARVLEGPFNPRWHCRELLAFFARACGEGARGAMGGSEATGVVGRAGAVR
jgi:glycosyltransferase involved in cell wall biosynthesis